MLNKFLARVIVSLGALIIGIFFGWQLKLLIESELPLFVFLSLGILAGFSWGVSMIMMIGVWFTSLDD